MSLYIRLMNNFWDHRKTIKLRTAIGDDALWIVPKLWSYAASNQPNGDFSQYSSEEIAIIIGCPKHATSIRKALLDAGFMDACGTLHDWDEHNGYHTSFANRAKLAAKTRWQAHLPPHPYPDKDKDKDRDRETSIASSMLVASTPHTSGRSDLTDEQFWKAIEAKSPGFNVAAERLKMERWLLTPKGRGRKLTRRFVVAWLAKVDVPMAPSVATEESRKQLQEEQLRKAVS